MGLSAFARLRSSLRTGAALGLRPLTAPVMVFLPLGIVLGPVGTNVISTMRGSDAYGFSFSFQFVFARCSSEYVQLKI